MTTKPARYPMLVNPGHFSVHELHPSQVPSARRIDPKLIWFGAGCLILATALVVLLGVGGYVFARWRAGARGVAAPRQWNGSTPLVCAGSERMTVSGVTAAPPSRAGVVATDNCELTLEDVHITAPIALQAQGHARVNVYRGSLHGSEWAVEATGNARVTLWQTKIGGGMNTVAPASVAMFCRENVCWSSEER